MHPIGGEVAETYGRARPAPRASRSSTLQLFTSEPLCRRVCEHSSCVSRWMKLWCDECFTSAFTGPRDERKSSSRPGSHRNCASGCSAVWGLACLWCAAQVSCHMQPTMIDHRALPALLPSTLSEKPPAAFSLGWPCSQIWKCSPCRRRRQQHCLHQLLDAAGTILPSQCWLRALRRLHHHRCPRRLQP